LNTAPVPAGRDVLAEKIQTIRRQWVALFENVQKVILGKEAVIERVLIAMTARGHVLLKDVPGVGKTVLAKTIAASIQGTFKRIQFTPDLLPMDITGSNIFDLRKKAFEFQPGAVFANILLADEINRATPKTQSALLEVMEERQVTVEGTTHPLDPPFQCIATMNPLDHDGTYVLPAAQMDRFMMMLSMGYPPPDAEVRMLDVHLAVEPILQEIKPVLTCADFLDWQRTVPLIYCSDEIKRYAVSVVSALRGDAQNLQSISPRSTLQLVKASQARAMLQGRDYVSAQDVQHMAGEVMGHRVLLADGRVGREYVAEVLSKVAIPA